MCMQIMDVLVTAARNHNFKCGPLSFLPAGKERVFQSGIENKTSWFSLSFNCQAPTLLAEQATRYTW